MRVHAKRAVEVCLRGLDTFVFFVFHLLYVVVAHMPGSLRRLERATRVTYESHVCRGEGGGGVGVGCSDCVFFPSLVSSLVYFSVLDFFVGFCYVLVYFFYYYFAFPAFIIFVGLLFFMVLYLFH